MESRAASFADFLWLQLVAPELEGPAKENVLCAFSEVRSDLALLLEAIAEELTLPFPAPFFFPPT